MINYSLEFEAVDSIYLKSYNIKGYDTDNNLVYEKDIDSDCNNVVHCVSHRKYTDSNIFYLEDNAYVDEYYKIRVFANNNELNEEQFYYDAKKRAIVISYKMNLNYDDEIIIEYYKNICSVKVNLDIENVRFDISCVFDKTHEFGEHNILY